MGRKLAILFMISVLLSGCGMVKNLKDPGSKTWINNNLPPPLSDYSVVWFGHRLSREEACKIELCAIAGTLIVFGFVLGGCIIPYHNKKAAQQANLNPA